jgi:4-hydroxy-tetrahydrodipicolinate reductase
MLRILHVGLGPLGKMIVSDLARRGLGRVVAAVDIDPALAGKKLADVVPECRFDCPVVPSIAEAMKGKPSVDAALLTTSSDLGKCMGSLRELMALGLPIVSTCEELLYPWLRHKALAEEIDAACKRSGARVLGTGVNPGFLMDTLPVAATAVCRAVRRVKVSRIQDATPRRIPFQQKIGAGLDDAGFAAKVKDGSLRHVGLGESLHFVAHYLGLPIDRWEETLDPVRADRDLSAAIGPIPRGRMAGVRQVAKGWAKGAAAGDQPLVELEFQAAIGQADPHDRVQIDGEPPIDMVLRGGVHGDVATSAITLNAVPAVIGAGPGLHTMATVPMVRFAARG